MTTPPQLEMQLLIVCCRVDLDAKSQEQLEQIVAREIDWEVAIAQASRHGLLPLMQKHLNTLPHDCVPSDVLSRLRKLSADVARNNLRMTAELLRIIHAFDAQNLTAVPIKGPVLAQSVYGSIALRQFCDLDLLADPREMHRVQDVLASLGYMPDRPHTDTHRELHLRAAYDYDFESAVTGIRIEIHHRLDLPCFQTERQVCEILGRTVSVSLAGKTVRSLSAEDQFLYLCVHGAKHLWERLEWVCSVSEVMHREASIDWNLVLFHAQENGTERVLAIALLLANQVTGVRLPISVAAFAFKDKTAHHLASQAASRLLKNSDTPDVADAFFYNLQARNLRDQSRYILFTLTTPSLADVETMTLPKPLHGFYSVLRPLRVLGTYGSRLIHSFRRQFNQ